METKKIRNIIIILTILIIIIILCIILLLVFSKKEEIEILQSNHPEEEIIEQTNNDYKIYDIKNCVYLYLDSINQNKYLLYGTENKEDSEFFAQNIIDILDKDYINEFSITVDNVYEYVNKVEDNVIYTMLDIKVDKGKNIDKYLVHGFYQDLDNNYIDDLYLYVNIDSNNYTFSVEPMLNKKDVNFSELKINNKDINIQKNDNNNFIEDNIDNEYIAKEYLDNFKNISLANPNLMYKYLDKSYSTKRFDNLENFKKYINNNKDNISTITLSKYKVNSFDDYTEYICIDQYGNYYIFKETGVMNYTVQLDTYTIDSEEFLEKYNNGSDQLKVGMNLEKIFQALNRKDYEYIYSKLHEQFKTNNFPTLQSFEKYMQNNFFDMNKITYGKFEEKSGAYVYEVKITDATETEENTIEKSFIVQLDEGTDFVMSFNK